ncbi:MAG TPA: TonB-dependent receptor [Burkholderiales bacterium]|nr:TonB-dependent receptor [Burkholderiales bacterium]
MRKSIIAAALSAGFLPLHALAQSDDAITVTATRFPERRLQAPIGMTVITADEIARDTARTLPEMLGHLGGLYTRNNSGDPNLQIDLRGFGITGDQNTLVLLDGIRLNENDLSSTKLSAIPLQSIERIEILRGSGSVLYGGGATGGTINIITRAAKPSVTEGYLYGGAGDYGTREGRATATLAGANAGLTISGSHGESDNYRVNNRARQDNVNGDLRYFSSGGSLALKFGTDIQRLQLPGVRDQNQLVSDPRGATTPNDWSTRDGNYATLLARHGAGAFDLAADLGYRDQVATSMFNSFGSFSDTRMHSLVFSPRVSWNGEPLGAPTNLVVGADLGDWNYGRRIGTDPSTIATPFSTTTGSQHSSAFYFLYNAQVAVPLKLSLGWRTQRVTDRVIQAGFGASDQRQTRSADAGELGLQYALGGAWTLFGRLGSSFRFATIDDNGLTSTGSLLRPQTAKNLDAGVEYRERGLRLRASLYRIDLNNEIYFSPLVVPTGGFFPGANTNLSPTRREGLELAGQAPLAADLTLSGTANFQSARFRSGVYGGVDVSGKDVPLVPSAIANLQLAWNFAPKSQALASLSYAGRQRYDNDQANTFPQKMPSYTLLDLKLSRRLADWTLSAAVNNVFDKAYYSYAIVNSFACATAVCAYPQIRRSFFVSAELRLP